MNVQRTPLNAGWKPRLSRGPSGSTTILFRHRIIQVWASDMVIPMSLAAGVIVGAVLF